jgi:Protein of unknown function (DUF2726)
LILHYLPIIVLILAALLAVGIKLSKSRSKTTRWAVKARSPVSPIEQQLYHRMLEAFPHCIILSQVAISQLVSVMPGPGRQAAFNKICRLVADFVLCTSDFAVVGIIELDDSSHNAAHRQNADRNKNDALVAAGYKLVRFQAKQLPTVLELQAALVVPNLNSTPVRARGQAATVSRGNMAAR